MNARLQLLLGTLALALAIPGFGTLSSTALEGEIRAQMNAGGAEVTERVSCVRKNAAGASVRYACALQGHVGSPLRVRVDVDGRDWRAYWPPVQG